MFINVTRLCIICDMCRISLNFYIARESFIYVILYYTNGCKIVMTLIAISIF